ncbi:MAG: acyltransferase family protein [Thermosynechococcaceae cyanobacterium]
MIISIRDANVTTQGRNEHIDIAKGLGILLVVFGHNWLTLNQKGELFNILFSVSMPLFFFLSGIFFNPLRLFLPTIITKIDALIKPYFVTLTLVALPDLLFGNLSLSEYVVGMFYGNGSTIKWGPLWFLPHLFIVVISAWIVCFVLENIKARRLLKHLLLVSLLLVGTLSIRFFRQVGPTDIGYLHHVLGLPFSLDILPITVCYFLLGNDLRDKVMEFRPSKQIVLVSLSVFIGLHYFFDSTIDLNERIYGNAVVSTAEALSGIYIILYLAYCLQGHKFISRFFLKLGNASLFVFIFHDFFQSNSFAAASRFLGEKHFFSVVFSFFVGSIFPVLLWSFVKRVDFLALFYLPIKSNKMIQRFVGK